MTSTAKVFDDTRDILLTRDLAVGMIIDYNVGRNHYAFQVTLLGDVSTKTERKIEVGYRFIESSEIGITDKDYYGIWAPDFPFMQGEFTIRPHIIEEYPV